MVGFSWGKGLVEQCEKTGCLGYIGGGILPGPFDIGFIISYDRNPVIKQPVAFIENKGVFFRGSVEFKEQLPVLRSVVSSCVVGCAASDTVEVLTVVLGSSMKLAI